MQTGILTDRFTRERVSQLAENDWRKTDKHFLEPELSANLKLLEALRPMAQRRGRTIAQLAVAWVLRRPEVTAAIVGARRPAQIEETAAAADWRLTEKDIDEIEALLAERKRKLR
jgi:aryl-alcohol dehydrogenase-like predicted oxidoreductase